MLKIQKNCESQISSIKLTPKIKQDGDLKLYKALRDISLAYLNIEKGEIFSIFHDKAVDLMADGFIEDIKHQELDIKEYKGEDLNNKTCLIIPRMGIGDCIATTIAVKALKQKYPECIINFIDWGHGILNSNDLIDNVYNYPNVSALNCDFYISYEDRNDDPAFNRMSYADGILSRAYFFGYIEKRPYINIDNNIASEFEHIFNEIKRGKPIILINYKAGAISRQLPPKLIYEIITKYNEYYDFVFINSSKEAEQTDEFIASMKLEGIIHNLSKYSENPRKYVALVSLVDGVITCDSSAFHIASALNKPCVAVFSNIRSKSRIYDNIIGINYGYQGLYCESPCSLEIIGDKICPEASIKKSIFSPCLLEIPAEFVANSLLDAFSLVKGAKLPEPKECPACSSKSFVYECEINNSGQYSCTECGVVFFYPTAPMDYNHTYGKRNHFIFQSIIGYNFPFDIKKYLDFMNHKLKVVPKYSLIVRILRYLGICSKNNVMDIGTGTATIPKLIKDSLGCEVYCTEADEAVVRFINDELGLKSACTVDVNNLPEDFPEKFDVITSFEVMEHIKDPIVFLKDINKLLKNDGFMLISVPNLIKTRYLEQTKVRELGDYPPHHLTLWTEKGLESALKRAGFADFAFFYYPMYPARLFTLLAPMFNVNIDQQWQKVLEIYNQTRTLWEFVQITDSIFALASKEKTKVNLKKLLDIAVIKTLYNYHGDNIIDSYELK